MLLNFEHNKNTVNTCWSCCLYASILQLYDLWAKTAKQFPFCFLNYAYYMRYSSGRSCSISVLRSAIWRWTSIWENKCSNKVMMFYRWDLSIQQRNHWEKSARRADMIHTFASFSHVRPIFNVRMKNKTCRVILSCRLYLRDRSVVQIYNNWRYVCGRDRFLSSKSRKYWWHFFV